MKEKLISTPIIEYQRTENELWYENTNPPFLIIEEHGAGRLSLYTSFNETYRILGAPLPVCIASFSTEEEVEIWNNKQQEEIDFLTKITNEIIVTLEEQMKITGILHGDLPFLTLQGKPFLYYKIERNLEKNKTEVVMNLGYGKLTCRIEEAKEAAKGLAITMANEHRLRHLFKK